MKNTSFWTHAQVNLLLSNLLDVFDRLCGFEAPLQFIVKVKRTFTEQRERRVGRGLLRTSHAAVIKRPCVTSGGALPPGLLSRCCHCDSQEVTRVCLRWRQASGTELGTRASERLRLFAHLRVPDASKGSRQLGLLQLAKFTSRTFS